jgi:hypothetical protein
MFPYSVEDAKAKKEKNEPLGRIACVCSYEYDFLEYSFGLGIWNTYEGIPESIKFCV